MRDERFEVSVTVRRGARTHRLRARAAPADRRIKLGQPAQSHAERNRQCAPASSSQITAKNGSDEQTFGAKSLC